MAQVAGIKVWLESIPDDCEFVVWGEDGREYEVRQVGHAFYDETTRKAGVFIGPRTQKRAGLTPVEPIHKWRTVK